MEMPRVTGIGGVFFKSANPDRLYEWYEKHLGMARGEGGVLFRDDPGTTVWAVFPASTKYVEPSTAPFMLNYRVDDLDGMLEKLRAEGVDIDPKREDYEYGRFAWIRDPDGNRIELWEPRTPG